MIDVYKQPLQLVAVRTSKQLATIKPKVDSFPTICTISSLPFTNWKNNAALSWKEIKIYATDLIDRSDGGKSW